MVTRIVAGICFVYIYIQFVIWFQSFRHWVKETSNLKKRNNVPDSVHWSGTKERI